MFPSWHWTCGHWFQTVLTSWASSCLAQPDKVLLGVGIEVCSNVGSLVRHNMDYLKTFSVILAVSLSRRLLLWAVLADSLGSKCGQRPLCIVPGQVLGLPKLTYASVMYDRSQLLWCSTQLAFAQPLLQPKVSQKTKSTDVQSVSSWLKVYNLIKNC